MFDRDKIIYLAGIIDGEGSIHIELQRANNTCRKIDYFSIRLVVINTNVELMEWLHKNFKGKITKRKDIPGRRSCYVWSVFSFNAAKILEECLPYMIIKKQLAEIIIEFMNTKPKDIWNVSAEVQEHRKFLYDRMKKLNKHQL